MQLMSSDMKRIDRIQFVFFLYMVLSVERIFFFEFFFGSAFQMLYHKWLNL